MSFGSANGQTVERRANLVAPERPRRPDRPPTVVLSGGEIVVRVGSRPRLDEIRALCHELEAATRLAAAAQRAVAAICCDVAAADDPDIRCIDAMARLALTARRLDRPVTIAGASPELIALIRLAGLAGILTLAADDRGSRLERQRQAEEREEALGVEEEADPADLSS
jgi:STAS domain